MDDQKQTEKLFCSWSSLKFYRRSKINLKEALYTSYEELPLFLNAETLAKLLGVSVSSSYELMHEKDFPSIRIGSRLVVPKEELQRWIDEKTGKRG